MLYEFNLVSALAWTCRFAMATNCVQSIKPAVADGASVEMDRRAVGVPSERGEVSDRGRRLWEVELFVRDGAVGEGALQHRLCAVAAQVPVTAPVDAGRPGVQVEIRPADELGVRAGAVAGVGCGPAAVAGAPPPCGLGGRVGAAPLIARKTRLFEDPPGGR